MAEFQHHISREAYIAGLEAEQRLATTKEHKAAVLAELEEVRGGAAVQAPKETA